MPESGTRTASTARSQITAMALILFLLERERARRIFFALCGAVLPPHRRKEERDAASYVCRHKVLKVCNRSFSFLYSDPVGICDDPFDP